MQEGDIGAYKRKGGLNQILGFGIFSRKSDIGVSIEGKVGAFPLKNRFAKLLPRFILAKKVVNYQGIMGKMGLPRFFEKTFLYLSAQYLL